MICSRRSVSIIPADSNATALISIGKKELDQMINDGKEIEVNCHFCNTNYYFSVDELKELRDLA